MHIDKIRLKIHDCLSNRQSNCLFICIDISLNFDHNRTLINLNVILLQLFYQCKFTLALTQSVNIYCDDITPQLKHK